MLFACHAWTPTEIKRPPLKVEFASFVGEYPGIIAQEKGFFKAQGVDVELIYKRYTQLERAKLPSFLAVRFAMPREIYWVYYVFHTMRLLPSS